MPINSDSLLNFTFFTLDYEKTINLCDCQKKFRTYDPNFIRDQNPILSYKTYQDNLQILKDMIHFTSPYGNPAIYYQKKNKKQFDKHGFLKNDLTWKLFTTQFFFTRLFLLTLLWFFPNNQLEKPLEEAYYIPSCLFPLYYSILAEIKHVKNNWKNLRNDILSRAYEFIDTFNKTSPNGESAELKTDILPFTTKNIFAFYQELLKHCFPDELYQLAITAQKYLDNLIKQDDLFGFGKESDFQFLLKKFSQFYFSCQTNNSFFLDIEKDITTSEMNMKTLKFYENSYLNLKDNENKILWGRKEHVGDMAARALEEWETLQKQMKHPVSHV